MSHPPRAGSRTSAYCSSARRTLTRARLRSGWVANLLAWGLLAWGLLAWGLLAWGLLASLGFESCAAYKAPQSSTSSRPTSPSKASPKSAPKDRLPR